MADGKLIVDLWDVSQGDGTVIQLPDGKLVIIDTGPRNSPIIDWLGDRPRQVHAVIISHNDIDHAGSLPSLVKMTNLSFGTVYMLIDRDRNSKEFQNLWRPVREEYDRGHLIVQQLRANTVISHHGDIRIVVIYPNFVQSTSATTPNQSCAVVCLLHKDEIKLVWSGDAPMQVIGEHCSGTTPFLLNGPHHGGPVDRQSPQFKDWVEAFKPDRVFISVGTKNAHGHPAPNYLKLHVRRGCNVVCTQLTKLCDNRHVNSQQPVIQTAALLGLRPSRTGVPCRGCLRLTVNSDGSILPDPWDQAHLDKVRLLRRPKCLLRHENV